MPDLNALLNPASIAVVGASQRGNRGLQIITNLKRFGSSARIYPVHPREEFVGGLRAYRDLSALPEVCDFVAIALNADSSLEVLQEAIQLGIPAGLIIASGFGEGDNNSFRRKRLETLVDESGFLLCGPNCYGIVNVHAGFAAYSGELVEPFEIGRVALIMQSGALTHSVTDSAVGRGLGLSHVITTGNEVSVDIGQYVNSMVHDDSVGVIGVFIEGLRDVDAFADAAIEAARRNKPVVALTVGSSTLGQRSALAHTGAIAGKGEALAGLLRRCGVVQATDLDEFRELLTLFSHETSPTAGGVAFASISGGGTGLIADRAEALGVPIAELGSTTQQKLAEVLPDFATVSNPLDLTGAAAEDSGIAGSALAALQGDPNVGLVVLALNVAKGASGQEELYRDQARVLAKNANSFGAPVMAFSLTSGEIDDTVGHILSDSHIPFLTGTSPSLGAISAWMAWHGRPEPKPLERPTAAGRLEWEGRKVITGIRGLDCLSDAGIAIPETHFLTEIEGVESIWEQLESPVVLKIEAPDLAHKTESGGVETGISTLEDLWVAADRMTQRIRDLAPSTQTEGFLVQNQVCGPAVECIVGIVRDPQVGLVLTVAPGGVLAELGGSAVTTPLPVSSSDVDYLIDSSHLGKLLDGYRGAARSDRKALVELVVKFSALVTRVGQEIGAAELNPVMVLSEGCSAVAVDVLFIGREIAE